MSNDPIGWYHEPVIEPFKLTPEEEIELKKRLKKFVANMKKKKIEEQPDIFKDEELFTIE